jgi:hypothetical protein
MRIDGDEYPGDGPDEWNWIGMAEAPASQPPSRLAFWFARTTRRRFT